METLAESMEQHLSNYANAATVDREALANLTQTNATLIATNAKLTTKMNQCMVGNHKNATRNPKIAI